MAGVEPKDSRNREDRDRIARQATDFVWTVRMQGVDVAAMGTIHMTRRHLLDIVLELAERHVNAARTVENDLMGTARSEQHRARQAAEETRWTDHEAGAAHYRYAKGDRTAEIREGHRVYIHRQRRARGAKALGIYYGDMAPQTGGTA